MKKKPTIMGIDVPRARRRRKDEVSPGKTVCAIVEKKNADSPKPDITSPVVEARYTKGYEAHSDIVSAAYRFVRESFCS